MIVTVGFEKNFFLVLLFTSNKPHPGDHPVNTPRFFFLGVGGGVGGCFDKIGC